MRETAAKQILRGRDPSRGGREYGVGAPASEAVARGDPSRTRLTHELVAEKYVSRCSTCPYRFRFLSPCWFPSYRFPSPCRFPSSRFPGWSLSQYRRQWSRSSLCS